MKLSVAEVATALGRTQRQIRYLIKSGKIPTTKKGRSWQVDSANLPLSDEQRQTLAERSQVARAAFEKGLEPVTKAALPSAEETSEGESTKRGYSVTDLFAFQAGETLYREMIEDLGAEDSAARHLFEALTLLSRGCHCYHPKDKASRFTEARELAATAVADLLLRAGDPTTARRSLAERIEQELIPKVAGLVASYEKRSRQGRSIASAADPCGAVDLARLAPLP